ncbi:hypothetical protein LCGC14_1667220 [marine sediment metagenome]|uniref:Response regulatory domain-containing protein n=1 Tax=marine sediment metagenome TaxID=412755 RepID=A0A0F9K859_9ZZZZ
MRVLIIEDRQALAEEYLRIFGHLLKGDYSYTHVPSIEAAIDPLDGENWDVILVDNELGAGGLFPPKGVDEKNATRISNGYDLVKFRRDVECDDDDIHKSYIIGIAANQVALAFFKNVGTDDEILKLNIPGMAFRINDIAPPNT